MKILLLATILLSTVIVGSLLVHNYIQDTAVGFTEHIEEIEALVDEEMWDDAKKEMNLFKKDWEKNIKFWMTTTGHEEIDNIEKNLIESYNYINLESRESLVKLALLKYFFEHIYTKEKVNLHNLF
ncbi:DUF4363 family protein [Alkalibaculum sp. M08DMB]|uniref:DUF4363 family protein n=1 Tax=Alkalibaculum sporogenes TaxID=2655001 RepID=A0A6A7KCV0_9FIRM|nr:DUF4363 family protein [Alkalibaculum sporogenes]MPW27274.1 DUF4363 family protein [Alkalibaculum sporogenes]